MLVHSLVLVERQPNIRKCAGKHNLINKSNEWNLSHFRQFKLCAVLAIHSFIHSLIFFTRRISFAPLFLFWARSNKLIMLITRELRNVLVAFIGRRHSFYLLSVHHPPENVIYLCLFNQTKRPHLVGCVAAAATIDLQWRRWCARQLIPFIWRNSALLSFHLSFVRWYLLCVWLRHLTLIYCFSFFPFFLFVIFTFSIFGILLRNKRDCDCRTKRETKNEINFLRSKLKLINEFDG